jgi:hypothetical protein
VCAQKEAGHGQHTLALAEATALPRGRPIAQVGAYFSYASANQEATSEANNRSESGSTITISASYLMILQENTALENTILVISASKWFPLLPVPCKSAGIVSPVAILTP